MKNSTNFQLKNCKYFTILSVFWKKAEKKREKREEGWILEFALFGGCFLSPKGENNFFENLLKK
jgi:hypothetical protein